MMSSIFSTMVITSGLYAPTRLPKGILGATACFWVTMAKPLTGQLGRTCFSCVDDIL